MKITLMVAICGGVKTMLDMKILFSGSKVLSEMVMISSIWDEIEEMDYYG